jgi:hypothetical protein
MGRHETTEPTPLDATCPTCEANPGKECTWGVTTVRRFHKARQNAVPTVSPTTDIEMAPPGPNMLPPATAVNVQPELYARYDPRRLGL